MQGKLKFCFLQMEKFQGKKDPTKYYYNVCLLGGLEVIKAFLETGTEVWFEKMQRNDEFECMASWGLRKDAKGARIEYKLLSAPEMVNVDLPEDAVPVPESNVTAIDKADQKGKRTA